MASLLSSQRTIYFVREVAWDSVFPISTRMLAAEFAAQGWNVVWLNSPLMPWHFLNGKSNRFSDRHGRYVNDNVFALTPMTAIPFSRQFPFDRPWLAEAMWQGCIPRLRDVLRANNVPAPDLLFISNWGAFGLRHLFAGCPILYHVTDRYEGMPSVPKTFRQIQSNNLRHTNHVIATAPSLVQWLVDGYDYPAERVTVVTHGVRFECFQGRFEEPEIFRAIPRPRLVSVGNTGKLSYDGLYLLAKSLPEVQLVLLGPLNDEVCKLAERSSNVHALGAVNPDELPGFLAACDVGMIVYGSQTNEFVAGICPMKLFEYAAAGLPVVSVPLPVYQTIDVPLWQAPMGEEFAAAVREALGASDEFREQMRSFAKRNTWEQRCNEVESIVCKLMGEGSRCVGP